MRIMPRSPRGKNRLRETLGRHAPFPPQRVARGRLDVWSDDPCAGYSVRRSPPSAHLRLRVERRIFAHHGGLGAPQWLSRGVGRRGPPTTPLRVPGVRPSVGSMVSITRHRHGPEESLPRGAGGGHHPSTAGESWCARAPSCPGEPGHWSMGTGRVHVSLFDEHPKLGDV